MVDGNLGEKRKELIRRIYKHPSVSLVNIVQDYGVNLRPDEESPSDLIGACPFSREGEQIGPYQSEDFRVKTRFNTFYCRDCEKGGDVISFVSYMHSIDRNKATLLLASRIGIQLSLEERAEITGLIEQTQITKDPFGEIVNWEDFEERNSRYYETQFAILLATAARSTEPEIINFFNQHSHERFSLKEVYALMKYFSSQEARSNLSQTGLELFGDSSEKRILEEIQRQTPETTLNKDYLSGVLRKASQRQTVNFIELKRAFLLARYKHMMHRLEGLGSSLEQGSKIQINAIEREMDIISTLLDKENGSKE